LRGGNLTYLAGIWENADLPRQLAWYVDVKHPSCDHVRITEPRFGHRPGWTIQLCLRDEESGCNPLIKVIRTEIARGSEDVTGAVSGGYMIVKGSLRNISSSSRASFLEEFDVKFDLEPSQSDLYLCHL
jgi:hypothetical protein